MLEDHNPSNVTSVTACEACKFTRPYEQGNSFDDFVNIEGHVTHHWTAIKLLAGMLRVTKHCL